MILKGTRGYSGRPFETQLPGTTNPMADIIIIDDDDALRKTLGKVLERAGHDVREAADGVKGVELIHASVPDLVITDLFMPEKEGIETIMELREAYPELRILAVSGGGSVDAGGPLMDAELFGADASLAKPFGVDELRSMVEDLLER